MASFGTELRMRREGFGMSVDDLAREAHISADAIRALEESRYGIFPAKIYAQGAVRQIARFLARDDAEEFGAALDREWRDLSVPRPRASAGVLRERWASLLSSAPGAIGAMGAAAGLGAVIVFWGMRLFLFAAPPALVVDLPENRSRVLGPAAAIVGRTEKESRLTVNGREIDIDEQGNFSENIELQIGVNRLHIVSEGKFGKTSDETRYVLVE